MGIRQVSPVTIPTASGVLFSQPNAQRAVLVAGIAVYCPAAVVFTLREGGSGGRVIIPISLAAGESTGSEPWPLAVPFQGDVYFNVESGSPAGILGTAFIL